MVFCSIDISSLIWVNMIICGYKMSIFCTALSVWGVLQMSLMALFYYLRAVVFIQDVPTKGKFDNAGEFFKEVDQGYKINALDCFLTALLYLLTLILSITQLYLNWRKSEKEKINSWGKEVCYNNEVYLLSICKIDYYINALLFLGLFSASR